MRTQDITDLQQWARQSPFTEPGHHTARFDELLASAIDASGPAAPLRAVAGELCDAARGLISHYVAAGIPFSAERRKELDSRWVEEIVDAIVARDPAPLTVPRAPAERFVGCCRDFAALTIAALRHHGIPARSRVGFADYFGDAFWYDHVVVEYWDFAAARWVRTDPQFPAEHLGLDMRDLAGPRFRSAAEVWLDYREGRIDSEHILDHGASPHLPMAGAYYVRNYVLLELAHLAGIETLLWDSWGAMLTRPLRTSDDHAVVDRVAAVLVADDVAFDLLHELLAEPELDPYRGMMVTVSPSGAFRQPVALERPRGSTAPPGGLT